MTGHDRLPCGQPWGRLVDAVAEGTGRSAHVAGCPHCSAAYARLERQWLEVRSAAALPVRPPAGLAGRIVHRLAVAGGREPAWLELPSDGGRLRVSAGVLAVLAEAVLAEDAAPAGADVACLGSRYDGARITVEVALRFGSAGPVAVGLVRAAVRRGLRELLGEAPPPVDVRVVDVWIGNSSLPGRNPAGRTASDC